MATDVFTSDDQMFDRLLVLTDDAVYVSNPDKAQLSRIGSQLREGTPVKTVVPDADEVRYSAISSVTANKLGDSLNIYHLQGSQTRMKNVTFKDASAMQTALAALARRLAPRFQRREVQYGALRASLAPLVTAAVIAALTYVSVMAATGLAAGEDADIRGRAQLVKRIFVWVIGLLGPTGVAIAGGLVVLGCLAWLVARVKQPPLMVTLSPAR